MNIKESILTLFDDNVVGAISASDMRVFVETIFDNKENEIHVFETIDDIEEYRNNINIGSEKYPISKNDVIIITEINNSNWGNNKGVYIATKDSPGKTDIEKISADNYDNFIKTGEATQLISLDSDKNLTWINPIPGYYIEGTDTITNILGKKPSQKGPVWIASEDDLTAPIPGNEGDGYSWDGVNWNNIGQLRGPEGDVVEVAFANQYEVDGGYVEDKAVSPKTLKDSYWINKKENLLGSPVEDFYMLTSKKDGTRIWEQPIRNFGELHDVDTSGVQTNSFIYYNGLTWVTDVMSNVIVETFTGLQDTPNDYTNYAHYGIKVNAQEKALEFTPLVQRTQDLTDVSGATPTDGDILVYDSLTHQWVPVNKVNAGTLASRPINPRIGTQYFDTSIGLPIWYNGTFWIDANGNQV